MNRILFVLMMAGVSLADNAPKAAEVKDPVCSMTVDPKTAAGKTVYKGKTYYFCSKEDKETFTKSPEKFVKVDDKKKK